MEQEPTADVLLTELCRLLLAVGKVHDDLDALLRRASKAKQLPALREGLVSLRGTVERLHQRTTFLAPPQNNLRKLAKLAAFRQAFTSKPVYSLQELLSLATSNHHDERRRIARILHDYGLKPSEMLGLCPVSRVRLILQFQDCGEKADYYTNGLTPALRESLARPFERHELEADYASAKHALAEHGSGVASDIKADPLPAKPWAEAAKDYAVFTVHKHAVHKHSDLQTTSAIQCLGCALEHHDRDAAFRVDYAGDFGKPCGVAKTLYKKPTLEEIETHKADEVKRIREKFFEPWPGLCHFAVDHKYLEEQRLVQQHAPRLPTLQDLKDLNARVLRGPSLRVKQTVVTSRLQEDTPVASSQGLGWCARHVTGFKGYCRDCYPDGDPAVKPRICAYCGKAAQGNYAIHINPQLDDPQVDLCDACGGCDETVLSCETIWEKFAKDGVCS